VRQTLKQFIKANPKLHSFAAAVRTRLRRRNENRLRRCLMVITRTVERPIFVKVGANDGVTGDPCGDLFLTNANWIGLLVEPVPYCITKLKSVYGDRDRFTIVQAAIGSTRGSAPFYYISEDAKKTFSDLPFWYDQLGSFDRQHIIKHLDGKLEPFILTSEVNVEPLDTVLERHGLTRIDFLQIDTEGHDLKVLKSVDLNTRTPAAIFVEHSNLSSDDRTEMKSLLMCNGYDVWNTSNDFFAMLTN